MNMTMLYGLSSLALLGAYTTLAGRWVMPQPWPDLPKIAGFFFLMFCGIHHLHVGIHALDGTVMTPAEMGAWYSWPIMLVQAIGAWIFTRFAVKSVGGQMPLIRGIAIPVAGTLVLGVVAAVSLGGLSEPTPAALAITEECQNVGPNARVSILADDGDGTWTIAHVVGDRDAAGRPPEAVIGRPAEEVYEGEVAEEFRRVGFEVLESGLPRTVSTVYLEVELTTRVTPIVSGVVAFCTAHNNNG